MKVLPFLTCYKLCSFTKWGEIKKSYHSLFWYVEIINNGISYMGMYTTCSNLKTKK